MILGKSISSHLFLTLIIHNQLTILPFFKYVTKKRRERCCVWSFWSGEWFHVASSKSAGVLSHFFAAMTVVHHFLQLCSQELCSQGEKARISRMRFKRLMSLPLSLAGLAPRPLTETRGRSQFLCDISRSLGIKAGFCNHKGDSWASKYQVKLPACHGTRIWSLSIPTYPKRLPSA